MKNIIRTIWTYSLDFGLFLTLTKKILVLKQLLPQAVFLKIISKRHKTIETKIRNYVRNYEDVDLQIKIVNNGSKIIWFCWLQGVDTMPDIVRSCYDSVVRNGRNYQIRFLSLNNYKEFVSLPPYILEIYNKGLMKNAHFADILRTYLLYKYGGLWIDATIYVNKQIPDYYYLDFYSLRLHPDALYVSDCRWCNFFLFGKPGNKIMELTLKLFYAYLKKQSSFIDYFMMDYFIDIAYHDNKMVKDSIDSIVPINYDIFEMDSILNESLSRIHSLKYFAPFNKLHWKGDFLTKRNGEKTLYGKIIEI